MTNAVLDFIKGLNLQGTILDCGCLDVNGSIKPFYDAKLYTGLDMREGKNVDIVANTHEIPFPDNTFDNVTNLEALEHDEAFWVSIQEMIRVLKPNGILAISTRGINFQRHDYPNDYYRFTSDALLYLLKDYGKLNNVKTFEDFNDRGVFGFGQK